GRLCADDGRFDRGEKQHGRRTSDREHGTHTLGTSSSRSFCQRRKRLRIKTRSTLQAMLTLPDRVPNAAIPRISWVAEPMHPTANAIVRKIASGRANLPSGGDLPCKRANNQRANT